LGEDKSDFRTAMIELIETTRPQPAGPQDEHPDEHPDGHPAADRWLAYQRGELAAGDEAELEDHLVRCRDCFDLAQAAAAFAEPADEAGTDEEGESERTSAEWQLLRQRLAKAGGVAAAPAPPRRAWRDRRRFPYALAAALFLALLGSTAWNLRQERALATLRAPRPNATIIELSGGERQAPAEKTLAAGGGPWMLVFHPGDEPVIYRLAIRDAASGRMLSAHELKPDADLALTLELPEGLPAGRYRLELSSGGRLLEEHLLRVVETGRGG
jgi:hypothetical protein